MKIPFIKKQLPLMVNYFAGLRYSTGYQTFLAVNVKLHWFVDSSDLPQILEGHCSDEVKDFVCENTTDKNIDSELSFWIDSQRRYLNQWVGGCSYSSAKYWDEEIKRLKDTGETSYYKIDGTCRNKATLEDLEKYKADSVKGLKYLDQFNHNDCYFFGRQGGWFCFRSYGEIDELLCECDYLCDEGKDMEAYDTFKDIYSYYKACLFLESFIKESLEGAQKDFEYHLQTTFLDSDYLESEGFESEDMKIEKQLAAIAV